ncbi:MAG: preprotein translocase subunit SecY [archaeon]
MSFIDNLPEVAPPTQKRLSFSEKLKWTLIVLIAFFILGLIPLFGLGSNALAQFESLSIILGAEFGSIISLGIGPLVTGSIVLQLLNGSGIWKFDLTTHEGKAKFQGIQKLFSIGFIVLESAIYVMMGGLAPPELLRGTPAFFSLELLLIFQLILGGVIIMFLDELCSKWGLHSGISLFIAAGVSKSIFIRAFSPLPSPNNPDVMVGAIPALFQSLSIGDPITAAIMISALLATILVFALSVYLQAMKIEIPLSFGRVRGHGIRWPLNFLYTSNIPVILIAALLANIQLFGRLLQNAGHPWFGQFSGATPISGLVLIVQGPNLVEALVTGGATWVMAGQAALYFLIMMGGSVLFSVFWVQSAGLDARTQAKNMLSSGLQIPGFRRDERVLEKILQRYIGPLTVMGAIGVGFLAAVADVSGALSRGTGILLSVLIIYQLYENIARQHMMDINPMMRKFMGGG